MRKISISILTLLLAITVSNAQEIGLRVGATHNHGYLAIDGVVPLSNDTRLHADMRVNSWGLGFDALWDALYQPLQIESETFHWYIGAGGTTFIGPNVFNLGVAAEAGLEYRFDGAPLVLGIDWRPAWIVIPRSDFHLLSFGVNGRWVF